MARRRLERLEQLEQLKRLKRLVPFASIGNWALAATGALPWPASASVAHL